MNSLLSDSIHHTPESLIQTCAQSASWHNDRLQLLSSTHPLIHSLNLLHERMPVLHSISTTHVSQHLTG